MSNHKNTVRSDRKRSARAKTDSGKRLFSVPAGIFLLVILFFSAHWVSPYREIFLVAASVAIALSLFILIADYMTCAMSQSIGIILSLTYYLQSAVTEGKRIGSVLTP